MVRLTETARVIDSGTHLRVYDEQPTLSKFALRDRPSSRDSPKCVLLKRSATYRELARRRTDRSMSANSRRFANDESLCDELHPDVARVDSLLIETRRDRESQLITTRRY